MRTVEPLRARSQEGCITLIGAERHASYDRPPLSKQILDGIWEPARATLHDEAALTDLGASVRLRTHAITLDGTTVALDDGTAGTADVLVLATRVTARRLAGRPQWRPDPAHDRRRTGPACSAGHGAVPADRRRRIHRCRGGLRAASWRGVSVTVQEALSMPCERGLGRRIGALAGRLFTESGIDLRCDTRITRFVDRHSVELADGTTLTAGLMLVGVGASAADLDTSGGIVCNTRGRALRASSARAIGDLAMWWDPARRCARRSEHWPSPVEQTVVAADIVGSAIPAASTVPHVWCDRFGLEVQAIGRTDLADEVLPLHRDGLTGGPVKGTSSALRRRGHRRRRLVRSPGEAHEVPGGDRRRRRPRRGRTGPHTRLTPIRFLRCPRSEHA
jgi:NADPH-dependent 2,4-dienoyl-CoA reductase/sulfur reductase-like enzyme